MIIVCFVTFGCLCASIDGCVFALPAADLIFTVWAGRRAWIFHFLCSGFIAFVSSFVRLKLFWSNGGGCMFGCLNSHFYSNHIIFSNLVLFFCSVLCLIS